MVKSLIRDNGKIESVSSSCQKLTLSRTALRRSPKVRSRGAFWAGRSVAWNGWIPTYPVNAQNEAYYIVCRVRAWPCMMACTHRQASHLRWNNLTQTMVFNSSSQSILAQCTTLTCTHFSKNIIPYLSHDKRLQSFFFFSANISWWNKQQTHGKRTTTSLTDIQFCNLHFLQKDLMFWKLFGMPLQQICASSTYSKDVYTHTHTHTHTHTRAYTHARTDRSLACAIPSLFICVCGLLAII